MTKITKWKLTQWLLMIVFITYILMINMSPWFYSLSYARDIAEELESDEVQLSLRERLLLERELNLMSESGAYEEDMTRKYRNEGKLTTIDYFYIISLIIMITYGYGLFLSSKATLIKLLIPPILFLIIKTIKIYWDIGYYQLNKNNVLIWWLGLIIVITMLFINDRKILFVDLD